MQSYLHKLTKAAAFSAAVFLGTHSAKATVWTVDDVLSGIGNFGASLFHTASGSNPMSGSTILNFTSWDVSGTYDDVGGALNVTVINSADTDLSFTLSSAGGFNFNPDGSLMAPASVTADFSDKIVSTTQLLDDIITFKGGFVCCGNVPGDDPNSFDTSSGILALWGATDYNSSTGGYDYSSDRFGADIRFQLTPVPLPAALPLFLAALGGMGLLGWRRKRIAAA